MLDRKDTFGCHPSGYRACLKSVLLIEPTLISVHKRMLIEILLKQMEFQPHINERPEIILGAKFSTNTRPINRRLARNGQPPYEFLRRQGWEEGKSSKHRGTEETEGQLELSSDDFLNVQTVKPDRSSDVEGSKKLAP